MDFQVLLLILFAYSRHETHAQKIVDAHILVKGFTPIAETDDNYICATLDWWPPEKCNYNDCPWGQASVLNLDLHSPLLAKAIQAFHTLRIRIGGSLQDQVIYDVGNLDSPCVPFQKVAKGLFGFTSGCLSKDRWDELNLFFRKTGAIVTFGLNALHGRHKVGRKVWKGDWNSTNAHSFIEYSISKGYSIDSWEFGNELSGGGVDASVAAEQYGKDVIVLKSILRQLYKARDLQPLLLAPGGFFDHAWFTKFFQVSGPDTIDVLSHHIYNLGPGNDPHLINNILDPHHLDNTAGTLRDVKATIHRHGQWATAWISESGGAYNSGGHLVSDTFVNSFWYLDQLGISSKHGTKVYCRQSLMGGNYGLLNTSTFIPNPDYYSALLWHRLMGKIVLDTDFKGSSYLRSYAHCSKVKSGVALLLINLSKTIRFQVSVLVHMNKKSIMEETIAGDTSFVNLVKKMVTWVGKKVSGRKATQREEYHLTPKDGYLRSQTMVLNGHPLELQEDGSIPELLPNVVDDDSPLYIAPLSLAFVVFPNIKTPACR